MAVAEPRQNAVRPVACSARQVETIGDAYMVVGGIPTRVPDHATRVVNQAIDMVRLAREVAHPITGDPVQVSDARGAQEGGTRSTSGSARSTH